MSEENTISNRDTLALFHRHLDECEQCRNHPHDLCGEGGWILINGEPSPMAKLRQAEAEAKERGVKAGT